VQQGNRRHTTFTGSTTTATGGTMTGITTTAMYMLRVGWRPPRWSVLDPQREYVENLKK
jgi:hypothetical protein